MEKFISLLKKELLGEITDNEKEELIALTEKDEDLANIYREVSGQQHHSLEGRRMKEAQEAYNRHRQRLEKLDLI